MEVKRVFDLLDRLSALYPKDDILSRKVNGSWEKISVSEYIATSHNLAAGFLNFGLQKGDKVITICNNRPEWNFIDMAVGLDNMVHVPVYTTLSTEDFFHIFTHSDAKVICIGTEIILNRIAEAYLRMQNKPKIIMMDSPPQAIMREDGIKVTFLKNIINSGEKTYPKYSNIIEDNKRNVSENELFTIIYTSGTTGTPKGVMLSHKNLMFCAINTARKQTKDSSCKMLSFLPLCHIYERSMNYDYQYVGISVYYAENLATIAADLASSKADGFCAVPRVLEQMFGKLESIGKNLSGVKRLIYSWAFDFGCNFDNYNKNPFYLFKLFLADKLIYSKWRDNLGGKEMLVVSGGSAIGARIVRLFNAAKLHIFEGYGMTEASPVIAVNNPISGINIIGTVGPPMDGTEITFADDGEILTRGPHIMLGYYKDKEYTKAVIDKDGWLHTGDIGYLVDGKYLKITDRKKEIFKLSAGKYIAPQVIENMLKESPFIENCMVIGENQKFPSALIVPNFNKLHYWAAKHKVSYDSNTDLIEKSQIIAKIHREIENINIRLAPHEKIRKERIIVDEWNTNNNTLSQTLKLKRSVIHKKYASIIESIYKSSGVF
ncbi:MAG: long-chain fatty acid--CoA ligase [Bacteroidales bacterium]